MDIDETLHDARHDAVGICLKIWAGCYWWCVQRPSNCRWQRGPWALMTRHDVSIYDLKRRVGGRVRGGGFWAKGDHEPRASLRMLRVS